MCRSAAQPSFLDNVDFRDADRGHVASLEPCLFKNRDGQIVSNNENYAFLQGDCPSTVHPKLWRQGQLTTKEGLFEVTNGVYQVRGFDISNMTLIEGKSDVIVLDVLASTECAAAALNFYRSLRGNRAVEAVIYSHSHYDHFGGAQGILSTATGNEPQIPVLAPAGFMDAVLKENIVAGPAMRRRAVYMFGGSLPIGPKAHVYDFPVKQDEIKNAGSLFAGDVAWARRLLVALRSSYRRMILLTRLATYDSSTE